MNALKKVSRDDFEKNDIIVIPNALPKSSRKEQFSVPRSTATKKSQTLKAVNEEEDEGDNYRRGEEQFGVRKAIMLNRGTKEKELFDENVSYMSMKNKTIPVKYHYKDLKLQFTSVLAYLEAYMIQKEHHGSALLNRADVKYPGRVVSIVVTLSQLHSVFC